MITLQQAYEVVKNKYPDKRILSCLEFTDCYAFSVVTRKWNGEPDDRPVTPAMEAVRKDNGELFYYHIGDALSAVSDPIVVDITGYMSEEDVDFVNNLEDW